MRHARLLAGLALPACLLTGCLAIGGTRTSTQVSPTTGQQLVDLRKALDCGAISPAEYEAQKSKLLCR